MPYTAGEKYPVVYTTQDIQKILKCGKRQAYELMNSKSFPSFKIGSKHYIHKDRFIDWMTRSIGRTITL